MSTARPLRRTAVAVLATALSVAPLTPAHAAPSWSQVYELTGAQTTLSQVTTTGAEDVWAAGTATGSDGYARPVAYHTVGGTTTTTLLNLDWTSQWGRFIGIDGVADDDLWASGVLVQKASGSTRPLLAHWDGSEWSPAPLPGAANLFGELVGVAARASDDVWFAGTMDGLKSARLYHWNGTAVVPVAVAIKDPLCTPSRATVTALTVTAADVWLGLRCQLTTPTPASRAACSGCTTDAGGWRMHCRRLAAFCPWPRTARAWCGPPETGQWSVATFPSSWPAGPRCRRWRRSA